MKIFDEKLSQESKIELEKQLFGGHIYTMSHTFPSIYITNNKDDVDNCYDLQSFINYTQLVHNIADSCGRDLAVLFAESYKLYEIGDSALADHFYEHETFKNKMIIDFCTEALAHLSLALNQSTKLLETLNSHKDVDDLNLEIPGKDYCFIVMLLNNLFYYYNTIVNFITNKRYLNNEFIESISERFTLLISNSFETLRRIFKVLECYEAVESKNTFH